MSFNISSLPGLSTKRLEALTKSGLTTPGGIINFFPRRYIDRTNTQLIKHLMGSGEEVTVSGKIIKKKEVGFGNKKRLEITITDGSGNLKGVWFRGASYFGKAYNVGEVVAFFGSAKRYGKNITMAHPEVDKLAEEGDLDSFSRIIPIYSSNKEFSKTRITSTLFQNWVQSCLGALTLKEYLPTSILKELNLPDRNAAVSLPPSPHIPRTKKSLILID